MRKMSYYELHTSIPVFGGFQKPLKEACYVLVGVPFDSTSTYRSGARFAPNAIREASLNIETYSFRANRDLEDIPIHDLGNLHASAQTEETLNRLQQATKDLQKAQKIPIYIGGEHTITLGIMRGVGANDAVVSFDAHLDMRSEYMGQTTCHTTFMRWISEEIGPEKILEIGVRAACREELDYAKRVNIRFLTVQKIRKDGVEKTMRDITKFLANHEKMYLTIDMDVLDPAFAPAVQNPEPDGLSMHMFLNLLCGLCDHRITAFDVVEVTPHYDRGTTAIQAAKTIFEVLCHMDRSKKAE